MGTESFWLEKLRHSSGFEECPAILAQGLGEVCGASGVGIFLLDHAFENLLYYASWSPLCGAKAEDKQPLPARNFDDPLCLALHRGDTVSLDAQGCVIFSPSVQLLHGNGGFTSGQLLACPLSAWGKATVGGVMLTFKDDTASFGDAGRYLCAYGALLLAFFMRKRNDGERIRELTDVLTRLESNALPRKEAVDAALVGGSPAMAAIREQICRVSQHTISVLLTGETGTGKEVAASAIHAAGPRRNAPFVKINCGALPAPLLESELFGHRKGAFSGAYFNHPGLLHSANGGTVLLDEIGELPMELQPKLLRFLQDHEVRPVGDIRSYPIDVRIISATNIDMREAIEQERFRKDLYYRLCSYHIHMPPLNEHPSDIVDLAMYFLKKFCVQYKTDKNISADDFNLLIMHKYNGNVRELSSMIEGYVVSDYTSISEMFDSKSFSILQKTTLKNHMVAYELSIVESALKYTDNNVARAASMLGMARGTLNAKLQKFDRLQSAIRKPGRPRGTHGYRF